ncbi:hypothetical protein GALMADRAFT_159441 [Galerina marginata CBS 339.88]|uniref:Extracellular membrane protein CFEM domain-containing protein n=1 Tax=Galerina marginata (strain CBS 339.88) TaxID=685588 RepID=A0A067SNL1_GALM3|nr:hypothetical protein GALMADRAFT_159441 [Galerina marginata CBS 339.88]
MVIKSATVCLHPASVLLVLLFALSLSPRHYASASLFPRDGVLDGVPPSCTQACQVIATSLDTCDYGTCLCTEDGGRALENCMNCLYGMSPSQDIYNAAQGTLSEFEDTCTPMLNITLNIAPIVSSSMPPPPTPTPSDVASTLIPSTSSTNTTSAATTSTSSTLTSATASSTTTSISPVVAGEYYGKQKCMIVHNKKSTASASKADIRSISKRLQIILPTLMLISSRFI